MHQGLDAGVVQRQMFGNLPRDQQRMQAVVEPPRPGVVAPSVRDQLRPLVLPGPQPGHAVAAPGSAGDHEQGRHGQPGALHPLDQRADSRQGLGHHVVDRKQRGQSAAVLRIRCGLVAGWGVHNATRGAAW